MLPHWRSVTRRTWRRGLSRVWASHASLFSSATSATDQGADDEQLQRIRNIGILAHIDAGKTTTTERMLFYAGVIARMGEVHDGDATMDFLPQERDRGITIGSAAISFNWRDHHLNLIDTPGHVDFTVEVERAVRVLDGAVTVLDGVAGVEAQTETVWEQADRYHVPRIVFVNKMDREGACYDAALKSLESRFHVTALPIQLPLGQEQDFDGVIDLIGMQLLRWKDKDGKELQGFPLVADAPANSKMQQLFQQAIKARQELIEKASDFDDQLAELFLMEEEVDAATLRAALRRITVHSQRQLSREVQVQRLEQGHGHHHEDSARKPVVTLCGSALKNKGVQPLLDAIVDFLPSPLDLSPFPALLKPKSAAKHARASKKDDVNALVVNTKSKRLTPTERKVSSKEPLVAMAFKVKHERQRGLIVYLRVYSGELHAKSLLMNTSREQKERMTRLMLVNADDADEVECISAGNIGAAVGLKHTYTGDTLVLAKDTAQHAVVLPGVQIPKPVFTCSIEAESSTKQKDMDDALNNLQREDPTFHVTIDEETGQTLMSGMGELHLEIIQERLKTEYKLKPTVGAMRIAYLESVQASASELYVHDAMLGTERQSSQVKVHVEPLEQHAVEDEEDQPEGDEEEEGEEEMGSSIHVNGNIMQWQRAPKDKRLPHGFMLAIEEGIEAALSRGPLSGNRLSFVKVVIDESGCKFDADSSAAAFRVGAAMALKEALKQAAPVILEPVMRLEVQAPDRCIGDVLSDLNSQRRAQIHEVTTSTSGRVARSVVQARVPLINMVGYATILRSKTQGEGSFDMHFGEYVPVDNATHERLKLA